MYSLNAVETVKIATTVNTYLYEIISLESGLAILSSDDTLHLLDPRVLSNGGKLLMGVGDCVTCCTALNTGSLMAVAGRDSMVRFWDLRSGELAGKVSAGSDTPLISLASCSQFGIAGGSELTNNEASIFIWDLRSLNAPLKTYTQTHSDDITDLRFHPTDPNILLSGSTDGLVNIYNISIVDEDESLLQTINHCASVNHCDFLSDSELYAISHDEKFSIYRLLSELDGGGENFDKNFGDMRKHSGGEYVANIIGRPDGSAVMGIGNHSQESFDLIQLANSPWKFIYEQKVTLAGAHGPDIVRSFCFVDDQKTIFTCGEDSQVKAWCCN